MSDITAAAIAVVRRNTEEVQGADAGAWKLCEFVLPDGAMHTADDPDRARLEFLQSTYEAAAERGGWNRAALEP